MADYLIERGIPSERIIVEDASLNTAQNIEFSAQHFDRANDAIGIVTNNFHEHRALAIVRKAGVAHAVGIAAPSDPAFLPNNLARESLSLIKDFLVGNLQGDHPACWLKISNSFLKTVSAYANYGSAYPGQHTWYPGPLVLPESGSAPETCDFKAYPAISEAPGPLFDALCLTASNRAFILNLISVNPNSA